MADEDSIIAQDPSRLTTAALLREVANLKEMFSIQIAALNASQNKFEENLVRVPTEVQKAVAALKELLEQRFGAIDKQLIERDSRRQAEKQAAEAALAAALQSQKELSASQDASKAEAIRKTQETTDKQIESIRLTLDTIVGSLNDKIAGISSRLDRGEGVIGGGRERQTEWRSNSTLLVAIIVAALVAGGLLVNVLK